jgi:hypothetical protein
VDFHNNVSAPSALVSGRVPDVVPPGPTRVTSSEGHQDHIRVEWSQNQEPDLAGYQVYRTICDRGVPYRPKKGKEGTQYGPADWALIGELLVAEAKKRLSDVGCIYFDDFSVPPGSPLCYAYWVRAFDMRRNLYNGMDGFPASHLEYVCQKLREETPPPFPIVSALKARNDSVLIEWLSSPVQDLWAFHVYRSDSESGQPAFLGCVFTDGTVQNVRWKGGKPGCENTPAEAPPAAVKGQFIDTGVEPNRVYWYRVSALDWLGNESEGNDIKQIPSVTTFTYSIDLPETPAVLPCNLTPSDKCGLTVRWGQASNPASIIGFVVFRASAEGGPYRQVSPVVAGTEFSDGSAIRGTPYWYVVHSIDRQGRLSKPSQAVRCDY